MEEHIDRLWAGLCTIPLDMLAACEGRSRSVRSVVAASTGLSPAHLSQSGLAIKSAKRAQSIQEQTRNQTRRQLAAKDYSPDEVDQILAEQPDTLFAGLAYRLGQAAPAPLGLAMQFGARVDRLIASAAEFVAVSEMEPYKALLLDYLQEEMACCVHPDMRVELNQSQAAVSAATDWAALEAPTSHLIERLLLAVLAAVDVEWGARYFGGLSPTPTFLWLSPRFHPDFNPENPKRLKHGVVSRPIGNLLRLMWTVAKRGTSKQEAWPTKPPGPSGLARDIASENIGDGLIRKWSTGAKPATLDQLAEVWKSLCESLSGSLHYELPLPWIVTALWMERALVKRQPDTSLPRTVIFLSDVGYQAAWKGHRRRWAAHLHEPGDRPWPEWLLAYSSWPDWMRPSQSSGRESSPRDCQ